MIHKFRNLVYTNGSDLVRCNKCDTMMVLPSCYDVCPVCGETHCIMDIEQDCELDVAGWEEPIIEDVATYCESGDFDEDGYAIPKLIG